MTTYILTDTDYESPSTHAVVTGPAGFDFKAAQAHYLKAKIKSGFVAWLCRYHGFLEIDYETVEVINFEQPTRQGPMDPVLGKIMQGAMETVAKSLSQRGDMLRLLKSGKPVRFDASFGVGDQIRVKSEAPPA